MFEWIIMKCFYFSEMSEKDPFHFTDGNVELFSELSTNFKQSPGVQA